MKRLIVIGAGPVGLVAALGAARRGMDVSVLEAGVVGEHLRRFGQARFFTPFGMNLPSFARALVPSAPPEDALLTGPEMADRVLVPLARSAPLAGRVRERHRVVAVGRARLARTELVGHPVRAERPFRVVADTPAGEVILEAERVLDASGVYGTPTAVGAGGLPARGERAHAGRLVRDLGALAARTRLLLGRRILLVGHGHSAANAIALLEGLCRADEATRVVWAVRSPNLRPVQEVADDPLPERRLVAERANALAQAPPPWLRLERRAHVEAIDESDGGALRITLSADRVALVDELVALTGHRPDLSFLSELALEIGPGSEGAARLERAVSCATDCLTVPRVGPADLASGEPGFHLVGAKSYGRGRTFLLATGYAQLETILDGL